MKKALFLDFDNMKFDTLQAHVEYIDTTYGIKTSPGDYTGNLPLDQVINKYLVDPSKHVTDMRAYSHMTENFHVSHEWHASVSPMKGMLDVLPRLAEKYDLYTVTARPRHALPVIERLIETHIPGCIKQIHCVYDYKDKKFQEIAQKRDFIINFQGEKVAFIDDSPKEILRTQDVIPSYLFDPLGRFNDMKDIQFRVRSWKEIGNIFL